MLWYKFHTLNSIVLLKIKVTQFNSIAVYYYLITFIGPGCIINCWINSNTALLTIHKAYNIHFNEGIAKADLRCLCSEVCCRSRNKWNDHAISSSIIICERSFFICKFIKGCLLPFWENCVFLVCDNSFFSSDFLQLLKNGYFWR